MSVRMSGVRLLYYRVPPGLLLLPQLDRVVLHPLLHLLTVLLYKVRSELNTLYIFLTYKVILVIGID